MTLQKWNTNIHFLVFTEDGMTKNDKLAKMPR